VGEEKNGTGVAMTIRDVADLLLASRERIDFYWNFYVIVLIALIGWLVSLKKPLTRSMKLLISIAYLIGASMNYLGLYSSYTAAEALRTDLLQMMAATSLTNTHLFLEQYSFLAQRPIAFGIHLILGSVLLFAIWWERNPGPNDGVNNTDS
jgi:hypothetical protein